MMIHISIPIISIKDTLFFYSEVLGCKASRVTEDRIDFDFFHHHLVAQLSSEEAAYQSVCIGSKPNHFPLRHFGVIVNPKEYQILLQRIQVNAIQFAMPPQTIFKDTQREQDVFLVFDPSGNAIEFKGIQNLDFVFT